MSRPLDNDRRRSDGAAKVVRLDAVSDGGHQEIRSLDPHLDLSVFASEAAFGVPPPAAPRTRRLGWPSLLVSAVAASLITTALWWAGPHAFGLGMGRVRIESAPAGLPVRVDGVAHGVTPLMLTLPVGPHLVEVGGEAGRDSFEMRVERGPQTYRVQLAAAVAIESSPPAGVLMPTPRE